MNDMQTANQVIACMARGDAFAQLEFKQQLAAKDADNSAMKQQIDIERGAAAVVAKERDDLKAQVEDLKKQVALLSEPTAEAVK